MRRAYGALISLALACGSPPEPEAPQPAREVVSYEVAAVRADACDDAAFVAEEADPTGPERGCMAIVVENHLEGWASPSSLALTLGGEVVYTRDEPERGMQITAVVGPLYAGDHVVTIEASIDPPGYGIYAMSQRKLQLRRPILVDVEPRRPAIVVVRLHEVGTVVTPVEERLELEAHLLPPWRGAPRPLAPLAAQKMDSVRAAHLDARVARQMEHARASKDVVALYCLDAHRATISRLRAELGESGEPSPATLDRIFEEARAADLCPSATNVPYGSGVVH